MSVLADAPFHISPEPTEPELLAKYFKVLAESARIRVLEALHEHGELSVGELAGTLELGRTNVSNHLACLRWCGFVGTRREHRTIYYRVADARVVELLALARALLGNNADHVAACRRVGGSC